MVRAMSSARCQPQFLAGMHRLLIRQYHGVALLQPHGIQSDHSTNSTSLKRPRTTLSARVDDSQPRRHFSSSDDQFKYTPPNDKSIETEDTQSDKPLSIGDQSGGPSDSFISHITSGGTPCDPAPAPFQLADFGEESLYTLVLLRHGESEWNKLNQYTGWVDVNLTAEGKKEARDAGRLLYENGIEIDHAFTSVLKRASFSCNMALSTARQHWVPVTKSWRLNERHYGALQGYNKDTAFKELGLDQELVMQMRRSYDVRPPIMQDDHPYWHGNDRRYENRFLLQRFGVLLRYHHLISLERQIPQTIPRATGAESHRVPQRYRGSNHALLQFCYCSFPSNREPVFSRLSCEYDSNANQANRQH